MHSTLENFSKRRSRRIVFVVLILIIALTLPSMANTVEEADDEPRKESIATNNPRFVSKGETREILEGQSTKLECVVEDLGEYVLLWKLNRTNILFAGMLTINRDTRFSINSDGSMSINNADLDLSGEYSCQISTNPPQDIVYTIKVFSLPIDNIPVDNITVDNITVDNTPESINSGKSIQKTITIFIQIISIILMSIIFVL